MTRTGFDRDLCHAAYRHLWFPVARSFDLDRPQAVQLLGEKLTVFRDAGGKARVVSRRCTHRGADLSMGSVTERGIECPYHGWVFDGVSGACVNIPSLGHLDRIPSGAKIATFPVREAFCHVWTVLAEPLFDPPEPADFPEFEGADLTWQAGPPIPYECGFLAQAENFRDVAHFPFVHREAMGDMPTIVSGLEVHRDGHEVWGDILFPHVPGSSFFGNGTTKFNYRSFAPVVSGMLMDFGDFGKRALLNFACPTSAETCIGFWASGVARDFPGGSPQAIIDLEASVYREDQRIVNNLMPAEVPMDGEAFEVSCPADGYVLNFRQAAKHAIKQIVTNYRLDEQAERRASYSGQHGPAPAPSAAAMP